MDNAVHTARAANMANAPGAASATRAAGAASATRAAGAASASNAPNGANSAGAANIATVELWAKLFQAPSIDRYFTENEGQCTMPAFSEYITQLCESRAEKPERVINRSGIERSFGHRLFSGARNPSRDTVLQLAFGFELSADEAQQLLKVAQATPLHPKVKRDAVIAYCLFNHKPVLDAQRLLYENGLPLMGGKKADSLKEGTAELSGQKTSSLQEGAAEPYGE